MRNALILDELERRPTQLLRDFVDAHKLHAYAVPVIQKTSKTMIFTPDEPILDDALATDWLVECKNGAQVLGLTQHELYSGQLSTLVKASPADATRLWSVTLTPPREVSQAGLAGVRLVVHPGDVDLAGPPQVNLVVNDVAVNLAQTAESYQLDLAQRSWQVLEVPFSAFGEGSPAIDSEDAARVVSRIAVEGNLDWIFHLDDVRLVADIPNGLSAPDMTAVLETRDETVPSISVLEQNNPNPFNSQTVLRSALPSAAEVDLVVYNLAGQKVAQLAQGPREGGFYALHWDGRSDAGHALATGVYVYRLHTDRISLSRKLLLIR